VGATQFVGLIWKERCMDTSENDPGTSLSCLSADRVTPERIGCVNADPDYVSFADCGEVGLLKGFVYDTRITE
jgi:hypothetical protein